MKHLLNETFSYPDGALTNVAPLNWFYHSGSGGSANTLNVVAGRAFINQGDLVGGRDDYNSPLSSTFNPTTDNTSVLYSSFTVNFSALPVNAGTSVNGSYFAHFKSSAPNEFYGRIGASLVGAAPGNFRIAIANEAGFSSTSPTYYPMDLSLNTTYRIVSRLSLATDTATLWINPVLESDLSVTATDAITYAAGSINSYALRQGTSGNSPNTGANGALYIDDLVVGTAFVDVVPEPSALALAGVGALILAGYRRRN
jgi:hypothetical protein